MKKLIFIFSMLVAAVCASAQPGGPAGGTTITITGLVTDILTGDPVSNREVYATTLDSISSSFGLGITDINGAYQIDLPADPSATAVSVIVIDNCGNNGIIEQIVPVTNSTATANFQVPVCSNGTCVASGYFSPTLNPLEIQFSGYAYDQWGDSTTVFTYSWDFGDGTTGSGESPLHTYAQAGVYTVVLTASSPDCTATFTFTVAVELLNYVTVSGTVTDPNGALVPFWQIQAGDFPYYQFVTTDANGFYTVQVPVPAGDSTINVYTYNFCDSSWNTPIGGQSVVVAPIINNTATANFVLCDVVPPVEPCSAYMTYYQTAPQTFAFQYYAYSADNSPVASVTWDFGDGNTSTEDAPEHTYAIPGVYTVLLTTTTESGCETHSCDVVFAFDDSTYCPIDTFYYGCQAMYWTASGLTPIGLFDPLTIQFNDISFGAVATRLWDFGDGTTSTDGPVVSHTYAAPGLYDVTLTITTLDGCESTVTMQVFAGDYPWIEHGCQALFMPFPDSTGNGFFFLDLSITDSPVQSWAWDFGDNTTSTEQNPYHAYTQPGIYTVTLTIQADSCSSVIAFEIDTNNPFNKFAGGGVQGQAAGVTGTKEPETLTTARIAPNPVTDRINVAFESTVAQDIQVNVVNATGKVVRSTTTTATNGWNALQIPAEDLSAGFYYLQIQGGKSTQTVKLVKADR